MVNIMLVLDPGTSASPATKGYGRAQAAQARLKEARDEAAAREEQFERELATARSLADMQRELAADRATRCAELEGIIRELQKNMEVPDPVGAKPPAKLQGASVREALQITVDSKQNQGFLLC